MTAPLFETFPDFNQQINEIKDAIVETQNQKARNLANKVCQEQLEQTALEFADTCFSEFRRQLQEKFPEEPWSRFAQMRISSLKQTYFYNNLHFLGKIQKILNGQEVVD